MWWGAIEFYFPSIDENDIFVYVHIPFCKRRCLYCDFISSTDRKLISPYFLALEKDIKTDAFLPSMRVRTIYFGGGTPSLVDEDYIERVFEWIVEEANSVLINEVTIEANPENITRNKVRRYRDIGINRVSLGIQACEDEVLKLSGRSHNLSDSEKAAGILREEFDNLNFDFIVGLPGMTMRTVEKNLEFVIRFNPDHVSVYTLEFHESAPLTRLVDSGLIKLPKPEKIAQMFDFMASELLKMGYVRYEISNFAKPGKESIHNLAYWKSLNYLGFGVSAGGHVGRYRYVKTLDIKEYIKDPTKLSYESENDDCKEMKEVLFMGLRLLEGVDVEGLKREFGGIFDAFLEDALNTDLFELKGGNLKLSEKGLKDLFESFEFVVGWDCRD